MHTSLTHHSSSSPESHKHALNQGTAIAQKALTAELSSPATGCRDLSWDKLAEEAGYRIGPLAKLCRVSLRTLERHFTEAYGQTLSSWLRDVRLNTAYGRIREGESIKSVAYALGYKQLSHFSRAFKRAFGVSPRALAGEYPGAYRKLFLTRPPQFLDGASTILIPFPTRSKDPR